MKYPNRIIIKNKYENSGIFDRIIFNEEKILVKAIEALYEGNQKIHTKISQVVTDDIVSDLQKLNKVFDYGYRIMEFYDFDLFSDNESKTMILIVETINNILNTNFGDVASDHETVSEINRILKEIYYELIFLVLSLDSPKFEETRALRTFEILYNSFLNKYTNTYHEYLIVFKKKKKSLIIF